MTKKEKGVLGILGALAAFFGIKKLVEAAPPVEKPAVQLKLEWHSDPELEPESIHSADVTVTNPTDWYWAYELELFLGGASLGVLGINLDPHTSDVLTWVDIIMPGVEGEYPVYILPTCITTGEALARVDFEPVTIISPFDPWDYDVNGNGYIDIGEQLAAIEDYMAGRITISQELEVINLYVSHTHRPGSVSEPDITIVPPSWI